MGFKKKVNSLVSLTDGPIMSMNVKQAWTSAKYRLEQGVDSNKAWGFVRSRVAPVQIFAGFRLFSFDGSFVGLLRRRGRSRFGDAVTDDVTTRAPTTWSLQVHSWKKRKRFFRKFIWSSSRPPGFPSLHQWIGRLSSDGLFNKEHMI